MSIIIGDERLSSILSKYETSAKKRSQGYEYVVQVARNDENAKEFTSGTTAGLDKQIKKSLDYIDKIIAELKKQDPTKAIPPLSDAENAVWNESGADEIAIKEITNAGGFAAIIADDDKQIALQDILDSALAVRIANVRYALYDLGWNLDDSGGKARKTVNGEQYVTDYDLKQVGAGKNVVAVTWTNNHGLRVEDGMNKTAAEMAAALNAALPPEVEAPTAAPEPDPVPEPEEPPVTPPAPEPESDPAEPPVGPEPEVAVEPGAVTILQDIIAGKYGNDTKAIDKALDDAAAELESLGLMEKYDEMLNAAADVLSIILREKAKGVAA